MLHMKKAFERMEEGLAIFSRFPILTSDYILLYRYMHNTGIYYFCTNKADSQVCDKILPQQSFVKYVNLVRATHDLSSHGSSSLNKMCDSDCSSIMKYQYSTQYVG